VRSTIEVAWYESPQPIGAYRMQEQSNGGGVGHSALRGMLWLVVSILVNGGFVLLLIQAPPHPTIGLVTGLSAEAKVAPMVAFILNPVPVPAVPPSMAVPVRASRRVSGEMERLEQLYGRQIGARLDRALDDARISRTGTCRYRIKQGARGDILDIRRVACRAVSEAAQQGVVAALLRGAPLPAAPDPSVFRATVFVEVGKDIQVRF
jgi:hypothetical protein